MPQPSKKEIRQYRRDRDRLEQLKAELAVLEPATNALEDRLLEWIEDQSSGDTATVHGMQITVIPTQAEVNWETAFRDTLGDDAAANYIVKIESQRAARIVVTDAQKS